MTKRVLLFDTSSLFFRAFHALPAMNTSRGEPTSAIYGISVQLLQWLREQKPEGLAFALDAPQQTFRHEAFADYKAHRPPMPDPLRQQLHWLDRWLEAIDAPSFRVPGFEADDVLATLAHELSGRATPARIVTGDRDLFQMIGDQVDVLFVGRRGQKPLVYDVAAVEERFGVRAQQLPSLMAITGDRSDNLPGIAGIGQRTAAKLVQRFGDIDRLLASLGEVQPESLRDALASHSEQLAQNERLACLRSDVPLGDGARFRPMTAGSFEHLRALFVELEFKSLLPRLDKLAADVD
ncbi:MAG TPA: 5'-3' exonuclease H3TH domain-containing protein [Polyangiales bacterium]|nr:5'-3' exonuclease H3TH domain-containing protein [Polyangiales bacterium]